MGSDCVVDAAGLSCESRERERDDFREEDDFEGDGRSDDS